MTSNARHASRTYVFPQHQGLKDFEFLRLQENKTLACGTWKATRVKAPGQPLSFAMPPISNWTLHHAGGCLKDFDLQGVRFVLGK